MAPPPDRSSASREELLAVIAALEARIAELERRQKPGGPARGMPGNKPTSSPPAPGTPRTPRPLPFVRRRSVPTETITHAPTHCPDCQRPLTGGWVQRTREVLELPDAPVRIIAHQYLARTCPQCAKRV